MFASSKDQVSLLLTPSAVLGLREPERDESPSVQRNQTGDGIGEEQDGFYS